MKEFRLSVWIQTLKVFQSICISEQIIMKRGKMLGEELINVTDGEANVAVISGEPGFSNLEERLEGLQDAIKDCPKIHLGDVQYDNYDGLTVMKMYYQNAEDADTIDFFGGNGRDIHQCPGLNRGTISTNIFWDLMLLTE